MKIYNGYNITGVRNPVVTMGSFDGVHRGHVMLLSRLRERAVVLGGESTVVTFNPHPRLLVGGFSSRINLLTSHDEKLHLLEQTGIDNTVVLEFDDELRSMEACLFVEKVLAGRLGMKHMVVGFNHRFGRGGKGDFTEISACASRVGFGLERLGSLVSGETAISSTLIRETISEGRLTEANGMLGYDYFVTGTIVEGRQLGRSIGFPTANISPVFPNKLLPGDGVYAVTVRFNGDEYGGMANIGRRPTVNTGGEPKSVEVHIFDFEEFIYDKQVTLTFRFRLRDEMHFPSVEALRDQLHEDRLAAERLLGSVD
ncbi:MAG: bifunctional riboflavin kinase/FAD synthetase [Bacteroidetes bacterium]|nr:bifunctional riboflavin kinase/FAD synthetase [Bacteroidota bacterium]